MITLIPVANTGNFEIQLSLFWYHHKKLYGINAWRKAVAMMVKQNHPGDVITHEMPWDIDIPHVITESCFSYLNFQTVEYLPLNAITSVAQLLPWFDDEEVLEIIDCDQFHIKKHPEIFINDDEIICDVIYEDWHLKSKSQHKNMVIPFLTIAAFTNQIDTMTHLYNGGFVPIIGKTKTFKKIIVDWIQAIKKIYVNAKTKELAWWSNMYALQVACANNKITMKNLDCVYIPPFALKNTHYCCHYSVDTKFNKKNINTIDDIDISKFDDNIFYNGVKEWYHWRKNENAV